MSGMNVVSNSSMPRNCGMEGMHGATQIVKKEDVISTRKQLIKSTRPRRFRIFTADKRSILRSDVQGV